MDVPLSKAPLRLKGPDGLGQGGAVQQGGEVDRLILAGGGVPVQGLVHHKAGPLPPGQGEAGRAGVGPAGAGEHQPVPGGEVLLHQLAVDVDGVLEVGGKALALGLLQLGKDIG